ncbi:MAG: hypothetical protein M1825_001029 [Sarcosagium campestre]|nr:MAG: hypothetical protein M1825_001029 [Sarcosagium campestre]
MEFSPSFTYIASMFHNDPTLAGHPALQGWSPIIGIVTAIIGNVLISFALNIQRYAHIRLNQEHQQSHQASRTSRSVQSGYGTVHPLEDESWRGSPDRGSNVCLPGSPRRYYAGTDDDSSQDMDPLSTPDTLRSPASAASSKRPSTADNKDSEETQKTYLKSPYWWLGIILMTIGEAGNFIAYGFAPASIVSPLGVVALVSNCVIAPFMLKERFRQRDFIGVLVAVAGAVTVVLSAKSSEKKLDPDAIWYAITRWEFESYMGITVAFILVGMWSSAKYGDRTLIIDLGLVGLFGGYTALSTKGVASLLSYKLWHVLTFPITYILLLVLVVSALLQIKYINRALQRFDSTQVIPTQFVLFTLSVIIGSAVLYRDFRYATLDQVVMFVSGCGLTFLGVWAITSGRPRGGEEWEDGYHGRDEEQQESAVDAEREERYAEDTDDSDETYRTLSWRTARTQRIGTGTSGMFTAREHSSIRSAASTESEPPIQIPCRPLLWHERLFFTPEPNRTRPPPLTTMATTPAALTRTRTEPVSPSQQHLAPPSMNTPRSSSSRWSTPNLTPGPILPPLSNSLTAVIAATLRRGFVDGSPASRRRVDRVLAATPSPDPGMRPLLGASRRPRGLDAATSFGSGPSSPSPLKKALSSADALQRQPRVPSPSGFSPVRSRSLGSTLGDKGTKPEERQ